MATRDQQIPDEKKLEKRVISEISSVGLEIDLGDGTTLIHNKTYGYVVNPEGNIIGYKARRRLIGGPNPWVDAEMRSNGVKGPGYSFGIYPKRKDLKK
jgi:hypothetical protein